MFTKKKTRQTYIGIALSNEAIELASFNPKTQKVDVTAVQTLMPGEIDDQNILIGKCQALFSQVTVPVKEVHLSVPGELLRLIDMPKMPAKEMYTALSSEAERYKNFDNTEAVVDFFTLPTTEKSGPNSSSSVVFGALREDRLNGWLSVFSDLKVKLVTVDNNLSNVHRAMAGTGVLDGLLQQAGADAHWGMVVRGGNHVWFVLWQGTQLIELREVNMQMEGLERAEPDIQAMIYGDLTDEMIRTAKHAPNLAVWLSYGFSESQNQIMTEKVGHVVRSAFLGPVFQYDGLVSLPTVGACMRSVVDYPFNLNFLNSAQCSSSSGSKQAFSSSSSSTDSSSGEASPLPGLLMGLGMFIIVLCAIVWGGLVAYDTFGVGKQLSEIEQVKATKNRKKTRLESELATLSGQQTQQLAILNLMKRVKHRDTLFGQFLADLTQITPSDVWVYDAKMGSQFSVKGKGISHQSVILFARQFDHLKFVKNVAIQQVMEETNEAGAPLFDFEINGQPSLVP